MSEPQSPKSTTFLDPNLDLKKVNLVALPAKKRNIKADSAADALKQRFPEINAKEIDDLFQTNASDVSEKPYIP